MKIFRTGKGLVAASLHASLGIEGGYTRLGSFDINTTYNNLLAGASNGYRTLDEYAWDFTLKGTLWLGTKYAFARIGYAFFHGTYIQEGLRNPDLPDVYPEKHTYNYTDIRPVYAFGVGKGFFGVGDVYMEIMVIDGKLAEDKSWSTGEWRTEAPDDLYGAVCMTGGIRLYLF